MAPFQLSTLQMYIDNFCIQAEIVEDGQIMNAELQARQPAELLADIYKILAQNGQFAHIFFPESKNQSEAEEYMNRGERAIRRNDFVTSINYLNICIALLRPTSYLLPVAYAYRSFSLLRLKRFNACLMDVNRAQQLDTGSGLPEHLRIILQKRKNACYDNLTQQKIDQYNREVARKGKGGVIKTESFGKREDKSSTSGGGLMNFIKEKSTGIMSHGAKRKQLKKQKQLIAEEQLQEVIDEIDKGMTNPDNENKFPLPHIENPNEMIPNASAKVTIKLSHEYGRYLVATEDIEPGEVLIVERPFASVLFPQFYHTNCRYCFVRCEALISCPECTLSTYCSESCRSKAFDKFHRVECPILTTLAKLEISGDAYLALRLLLMATKQGANLSSMMQQHPEYKSPMQKYHERIEDPFSSEEYNKNVHNLVDHYSKLSSHTVFRKCYEASVLLYVLRHTSFYGRSEVDTSKVNLSEEEKFAGTLLLKFLLISGCNRHPIKDMIEFKANSYRTTLIGYGLYPLHSLMNHSCDPNTFTVNHKDSIVCYAFQPIEQGAQIFSNYNWTYSRFQREERQMKLEWNYFFMCRCIACEENWPDKTLYPSIPYRRISNMNSTSKTDLKDYERKFKLLTSALRTSATNQRDSNFVIKIISDFHRSVEIPCRLYSELLECFAFLLTERGNTYAMEDDSILCNLA